MRPCCTAVLLLLSVATSAGHVQAQSRPPVSTAAAVPSLVVFVTIDQMRAEYLDRFAAQFTGGLKRLKTEGAVFTTAMHDHAITETAPGHATAWSGRHPANTGVVLNEIGVADPQSPLLLGRGGGASPYRFRGSSLFDWMRTRNQFSRALSELDIDLIKARSPQAKGRVERSFGTAQDRWVINSGFWVGLPEISAGGVESTARAGTDASVSASHVQGHTKADDP